MSALWNLQNAVTIEWKEGFIPGEEQELHVLQTRIDGCVDIECSHGPWITKLKNNPSFCVTELGINANRRIIFVKGKLPLGNVTLRSKLPSDADLKVIMEEIGEYNK